MTTRRDFLQSSAKASMVAATAAAAAIVPALATADAELFARMDLWRRERDWNSNTPWGAELDRDRARDRYKAWRDSWWWFYEYRPATSAGAAALMAFALELEDTLAIVGATESLRSSRLGVMLENCESALRSMSAA